MTLRQLAFRATAREKLLAGAQQLADAVRLTLGPKSKSVLIQRKWGAPIVCNDGVTIAKELELKDPVENLAVQVLRQAAERTGEMVGDGTSTATVLAYGIYADGARNVAAGAGAVDLKRGLDRATAAAVNALRAISRPVATRAEKAQVACVSAHNDAAVGELIAGAMEKIGDDGMITVEESRTMETVLEVVPGLQFDQGFISPYFITDPARSEVVLQDAFVLLCDRRIVALDELLPLLEAVVKSGRPLLLVAEDLDGEALATFVLNHVRGTVKGCAVKAPGYGERRKALLEDLATVTGAQVISQDLGVKLESVGLEVLGSAARVIVDKDHTTLVGGGGDRAKVEARIRQVRHAIEQAKSDYDREKLEERAAKLGGGVAVIRVGAPTEAERKARKDALDDAISATRAAIAEGIVPGGGLALLRTIDAVAQQEQACEGDELTGIRILKRALEAPAREIAENSGVDGGVAVARMREGSGTYGLDAARNVYGDLMQAGIIDPTKVVRVALENAVSAASVLLMSEATMTDLPAERGEPHPAEPL